MTTSFSANRNCLLDGLSAIMGIVPHKPQRDILKCLKIKVEFGSDGSNDSLKLFATDLESYIVYNVEQNILIQNEGEFVVPAQIFYDYLKNLEDDTVNVLVSSEETLQINETGVELEVGLQDLQEFPEFPEIPNTQLTWVDLDQLSLKNALSRVLFAVAEKGHPRWGALSAVLLSLEKEKIILIGTDQHRASLVEFEVAGQKLEAQYLIAGTAMETAAKIFNGAIQIAPNAPNNVIVKNNNCVLFLRLVNGDFPSVQKFIPKHPHKLEFSAQDLMKQVKKAALAVDQNNTIRFEIKNDMLCLSTKTREQRKATKIEKAINYKGDGIQFLINCEYLQDLLKVAHDDEPLVLHFNQNHQPLLFTQTNFQHLLVPQT